MAERYSAEFLLHLRESPLCVKPPNLPPPEEWMGPPPETFRTQQKTANGQKPGEGGALLNQENRRPPHDRNGSRNASNPDEFILGPPRTSFASASATSMRGVRNSDVEKGFRGQERQDRTDRFAFRDRANDSDSRNNASRRQPGQGQDGEGWNTVPPRKSFGHEGAERFHGRMGGVGNDRFGQRDDTRRLRDRDDREGGDLRRNREFERRSRDQEGDDSETPRKNGLGRGKSESWFRENAAGGSSDAPPKSQRERIEKAKSWRDRDPEDNNKTNDRYGDRNDRNFERRWDRDRHARVENDPEWLDEPLEDKAQGHTEEDFKKFMETMKAGRGGGAPKQDEKPSMLLDQPPVTAAAATVEVEHKVVSAPATEQAPDKFFAAYGSSGLDGGTPIAEVKDAAKPRTGKSSRFMAFLNPQEDSRAKTEPPTPAPAVQPGDRPGPAHQSEAEKEAFALLISKLHMSGLGPALESSAPPSQTTPGRYPETSPFQEMQQKSAVTSPEPFQQYGNNDRREDPRIRSSQHSLHDIISPRPVGLPMPPPVSRPEQALQDLLAQRHHLPNQQLARAEQQNMTAVNRNREFLVGLMQGRRETPEPPRNEQLLLRMPQPTKQVPLANMPDREQEYPRERSSSQRQQMRGPPGFLDESQFHPGEVDGRPPPQPTQILQRPPPPPGLDHQMHPFHMGGVNPAVAAAAAAAGQMPPQRPMIPPPGLMNNGPRNVPMPGMFPPNFPHTHGHGGPGSFPPGPPPHGGGPPPPDGMGGPSSGPPRPMQPPPGFYGGPPPPGFMPPPGMGGGGGFQGPDGPQPRNAGPGPGLGGHSGIGGYGGPPGMFDGLERMNGLDRRGMMPPPGGYRGP
ncbi:uncharacterized protein B0H64DRAFT_362362 [Chaetomium fimeti]|uniref:Uncharacterized protein n=1 Tax=Chaetomium fimeti TaxID=1854472 RepID=A0AAE0LRG6_9PEZI|nr:hypothetical protein B0H64DRAFT_362362 [Chaetomium fimeti]